jgi:hypothetical protein
MIMTDHNTIEGAQIGKALAARHGIDYDLIVGEEVTTRTFHMNAYPLEELVPPSDTADSVIDVAHAQGAVVQLNHPGYPGSDWVKPILTNGLGGTRVQAWEHLPPSYDTWSGTDTLPVLVGSTDTHSGTFHRLERSVILASSTGGGDVAGAVRHGRIVLVDPNRRRYSFGANEDIRAALVSALEKGRKAKKAKAKALRSILQNADLAGLLRASPAEPVALTAVSGED